MSSAKGFYAAQEGHIVNVLPPQSISGGKTGLYVNMADYAHLSLIIAAGALASGATAIELFSATSEAGAGAVAQPFNYWSQAAGGAGNDVFQAGSALNSGRTYVPSGSFAPAAVANGLIVIELNAAQLPQGSPYVGITLTEGVEADYYAVIAVLSGGRFTGDESPSVTV